MDRNAPGTAPYHTPVLVAEVVRLLEPAADGLVVDATFGGGGHTRALLDAFPEVRILALDRDPDAIARAPRDPRLRVRRANFGDLGRVIDEEVGGGVDGALFDLGVSSHQLDTAARGFSYHRRGPLDMRMGPDAVRTAAEIVNEWDVDDLAAVFRRYGEERHARRIAEAICARRPVEDTAALAEIVAEAVPARDRRGAHPARRVFQALRIAVNEELEALREGLDAVIERLREGGRIVVISYHSLEDRIVKRRFAEGAEGCTCPPDLPECGCSATAELRLLTRRAVRPDDAEIAVNPRARSARLRAAEKVAA